MIELGTALATRHDSSEYWTIMISVVGGIVLLIIVVAIVACIIWRKRVKYVAKEKEEESSGVFVLDSKKTTTDLTEAQVQFYYLIDCRTNLIQSQVTKKYEIDFKELQFVRELGTGVQCKLFNY